jgi:biopolymer transport protein ExbD
MRLVKRSRGARLEINMTPMIDVTFLLLIFFMTVNQVSNINKERVSLPQLTGSQDQSEGSITVNIDEAGQIIVSGNAMTPSGLVTLVTSELAKVENDPSRLTIVVRADRRGTSRAVNEIVKMLERLEIRRVRIAVEKAS